MTQAELQLLCKVWVNTLEGTDQEFVEACKRVMATERWFPPVAVVQDMMVAVHQDQYYEREKKRPALPSGRASNPEFVKKLHEEYLARRKNNGPSIFGNALASLGK